MKKRLSIPIAHRKGGKYFNKTTLTGGPESGQSRRHKNVRIDGEESANNWFRHCVAQIPLFQK